MHDTDKQQRTDRERRAAQPRRRRGHRGRYAERPRQIPAKGWLDIGKRVIKEVGQDHVSIVAAGVAFYAFLAVFPAIAAAISIYGLVLDPQTAQQQFTQLATVLPEQARGLMTDQLSQIAGASSGALSWGLAFSVLLALWSASKGAKALFQGLDIVYDEESSRNFVVQNALTLLFTIGAIVVAIIAVALIVALPIVINLLPLPPAAQIAARAARWVILAGTAFFGLALLYRYAPSRATPRWRWVTWGAAIATVLWLVASWAFSFYVANFGSYNQTYGSLAAVVILLFWLFLTAFIALLGAEINEATERQTSKDSTTGPEEPMGERGATAADNVEDSE
ncbi:MAG: YihY family inner membrane protein [Chitinivibrionales bacterium]|nr:YihY family inner membrane protein [Chitinivibrionales bacterium]